MGLSGGNISCQPGNVINSDCHLYLYCWITRIALINYLSWQMKNQKNLPKVTGMHRTRTGKQLTALFSRSHNFTSDISELASICMAIDFWAPVHGINQQLPLNPFQDRFLEPDGDLLIFRIYLYVSEVFCLNVRCVSRQTMPEEVRRCQICWNWS